MRVSIVCSLVFAGLTLLPPDAAAQFTEKKVLALEAARKIVAAAQAEATRMNLGGAIAAVDDGGWPILVERMDNAAFTANVMIAPGKARTAALFKKPSKALEDAINHGRFAAITAPGFVEMEGGLPIIVDGQVIGAIGASFDTPSTTHRSHTRAPQPSVPEHRFQYAQLCASVLSRSNHLCSENNSEPRPMCSTACRVRDLPIRVRARSVKPPWGNSRFAAVRSKLNQNGSSTCTAGSGPAAKVTAKGSIATSGIMWP